MAKDVLGNDLTETELALVAAYEGVRALLLRDDLVPAIEANVKEAVTSLWQAINDLALTDERPAP